MNGRTHLFMKQNTRQNLSNMYFMQAYLSKTTRQVYMSKTMLAFMDESERSAFRKQSHFAC